MKLLQPLILAAGLTLTACSGPPDIQASTGDPSVTPEQLTVFVVEASGGG